MGFMDNAAGNAVKKFGVVTEGKHQNCIVTMDDGPGKKGNFVFSQIVFLDEAQEQGRYVVREDLQEVHYAGFADGGSIKAQLKFKTGEECICQLLVEKTDGLFASLIKAFLGKMETYEERQIRIHRNMTAFFASTLSLMQREDVHQFSEHFRLKGLLKIDEPLKQMIEQYNEVYGEE